jgi:hypothetical protein
LVYFIRHSHHGANGATELSVFVGGGNLFFYRERFEV